MSAALARNIQKFFDVSTIHLKWDAFMKHHRFMCSKPQTQNDFVEVLEKLKQEQLLHKISKKNTVMILEGLFQIKPFHAYNIATAHPNLCRVSPFVIQKNYDTLKQNNVGEEDLKKYPQILAESGLFAKLICVKSLPFEINNTLPLLTLSEKVLSKLASGESSDGERILQIMSKKLQISVSKACEYLTQKKFLIALKPDKIASVIKLLMDFGIPPQEICNDLWVLRYNCDIIQSRLNEAKMSGIELPKTWMVRAKSEIFQAYLKRRSDKKEILGDSSLAEYLSERLECPVGFATYIIMKNPALENKSLPKIRDLIDFLYSKGFKSQHICRSPKLLLHNVATTQSRLELVKQKGVEIDALYMLTKSQKQFLEHLEVLVKNKAKTERKLHCKI